MGGTLFPMIKNHSFSLVVSGLFLSLAPAFASTATVPANGLLMEITGHIYPKDSLPLNCKGILQGVKCEASAYGRYHLEAKKEGELIYNYVTFSGPEGDQVIEQSWEKNGKVKKAIIENRAIGKRSQLEVKNGIAYYEVTDLNDRSVKKSEDNAEDNLVVPSTMLTYEKANAERIAKGETVQIKMAVLDRRDSFTFNVHKIKDDKSADGEAIQVLEMTPASFLVKAAVDPMYFYVKPKNSELFAFEGESGLRKKIGNTFEKMKVRTSYDYRYYGTIATEQQASKKSDCDTAAMITGKTAVKCEVKQ